MKESRLWFIVFGIVLISGVSLLLIVLILFDFDLFFQNALRFATIFHGMLAGVALGEFFKIRNNEKAGQHLLIDLIEELRDNQKLLLELVPLRKAFWMLGVRSGRAAHLPEEYKRLLWTIYPVITHYNEDLMHQHRIRLAGGKLTPDQEQELKGLSKKVEGLVKEFLAKYDNV